MTAESRERWKKLRVWLIKEGEALPVVEGVRLMRMGALAKYLAEHGHQVTWWSSSFIHQEKRYVFKENKACRIDDGEKLICLYSPVVYKKNISARRIIYHKMLGLQFKRLSKKAKKPDIILCAWPLAEFAREAIRYGRENDVPVVLDARDQWPDIFIRAFPGPLQKVGDLALKPLKKQAADLFRSAYGITAMIDSGLKWACSYAGRNPGENDRIIYIGNNRVPLDEKQFREMLGWWKERGVGEADWILCFFGTFGSHIAIDTVIKAVKELSEDYPNIKLVLGGGGDREAEFREVAEGCKNVVFAGWLDNAQMVSLMKIAKCGAFSIKNTFDFKDTFNNKAIQYISEGLPVLNSLSGFAKELIAERNMGITYDCDSIQDCKAKILQLYHDENSRKQMGENALECFCEKFDAEIVNRQFEEYLIMTHGKYEKEHIG